MEKSIGYPADNANKRYSPASLGFTAILLAIALVFLQWSASSAKSAEAMVAPLKIGFLMVGPINDLGWDYSHEQGVRYLESTLKDKVQTIIAVNVPESAEVERVMEKMIAQGARLIFTTSYGFLEPALRVAARHPDVVVMQCARSSPPSAKNVGTYFANQFAPMYVAGVVAGRISKTGKLGYVGGHPIPEILTCVNAFILGARRVNPRARLAVVWTGSWVDPATEAEATKGLIESGADVISSQANSSAIIVKTTEKNGAYSVGTEVNLSNLAAKGWLTGQTWNWGPYM